MASVAQNNSPQPTASSSLDGSNKAYQQGGLPRAGRPAPNSLGAKFEQTLKNIPAGVTSGTMQSFGAFLHATKAGEMASMTLPALNKSILRASGAVPLPKLDGVVASLTRGVVGALTAGKLKL